jgi:hypothetical protein
MNHPSTRQFARYALGEITDESELAAFEKHLLQCKECSRKAIAIDLIGSASEEGGEDKPLLHVSANPGVGSIALCGENEPRNIVSEVLLSGLSVSMLCPGCLAVLRASNGGVSPRVN